MLPTAERAAVGLGEMSASRVLCYHPPMPTPQELGLIVGASVASGAIASVATRYMRRPELHTVAALALATALAAAITVLVLMRTVLD